MDRKRFVYSKESDIEWIFDQCQFVSCYR